MSDELKILIPILVCSFVSILLSLVSRKRKYAHTQSIFPIITVIYSIGATVGLLAIKEKLFNTINEKFIPAEIKNVDKYLTGNIEFPLSLKASDIFLLNAIILIAFLFVKIVLLASTAHLKRKDELDSTLVNKFYEYNVTGDCWVLKDEWVNVRLIFKSLYIVFSLLTGLFFGVTWYIGNNSEFWVFIFPAGITLVTLEIYKFLNGYNNSEVKSLISGVDSNSQKISNYHLIREIYEKLFKPELLAVTSSLNYSERQNTMDLLKELSNSDDSMRNIVAKFFEANDYEYTSDGILAATKLVNKENVVFFNPFYRDLGKYIILPLINTLLSSNKCLVVSSRNSATEDVKDWINEIISNYVRMDTLWRVASLDKYEPDCEIGVINSSHLYDLQTINANKEFFEQTKFVIIIEPSLIINTSQIALSVIADHIKKAGNDATYCIIDHQCDGLVDIMSHIIKEEITHVVAPPLPSGIYTGMMWNSDGDYLKESLFDRQTCFFGNGVELASVAIKNQVKEVKWYSETKAPVKDISWIAGQRFPSLCKYMNIPIQQKSINDKIKFITNIWSAKEENEQFIIVNDEFFNMYTMLRAFLSRGKDQTFVNVFSENYLLRDYMRCNAYLFFSNPSAIPSIISDYIKTERNTTYKLVFMMAQGSVTEAYIKNELDLINYEYNDVITALRELLKKYTSADEKILTIVNPDATNLDDNNVYYSISKAAFEEHFSMTLKNAYYIVENEKKDLEYIDSRLFGHITQLVMPGQYLTHDGKYYQIISVSNQGGVILHRVSKNYAENQYYKQLRKYMINDNETYEIVSSRKVADIEFTVYTADISVKTSGYVQLKQNGDFRTSKTVDLSNDPNISNYDREYKRKEVLKILIPDSTINMRFTMTLLLSELFKTIFPSSYQYIAVLSAIPDDIEGTLNYSNYVIEKDLDDEYIYIIEDSDVDLGIISAILKNFNKIIEIITDYLEWHFEKMRETENQDKDYRKPTQKQLREEKRHKGTVRILERIKRLFTVKKDEDDVPTLDLERIENQVDNDKSETQNDGTADNKKNENILENNVPTEEAEKTVSGILDPDSSTIELAVPNEINDEQLADILDDSNHEDSAEKNSTLLNQEISNNLLDYSDEKRSNQIDDSNTFENNNLVENVAGQVVDEKDISRVDGTDIFEEKTDLEIQDYLDEHFEALGINDRKLTRYQKECFLKFGFDKIDERLELDSIRKYFTARGFRNNYLTKARNADLYEQTYFDRDAENTCDFCGIPISGVGYERLDDGRIRCNDCSSTAINSVEEFEELFFKVRDTLQYLFGIDFNKPITVKTLTADEIAKGFGSVYTPSVRFTERVIGYAQNYKGKYSLNIENGSPRLTTVDTMAHELTHIWQYMNWDTKKIDELYGDGENRDAVYEGMAIWASVQYLYAIGEKNFAMQRELIAEARTDVYGVGFRAFRNKYPFIKDSNTIKYTPFKMFPPI